VLHGLGIDCGYQTILVMCGILGEMKCHAWHGICAICTGLNIIFYFLANNYIWNANNYMIWAYNAALLKSKGWHGNCGIC